MHLISVLLLIDYGPSPLASIRAINSIENRLDFFDQLSSVK